MLYRAADWGRRHNWAILLEGDSDVDQVVGCQEHEEIDSVAALDTELGKALLGVGNLETAVVQEKEVGRDLLVIQARDRGIDLGYLGLKLLYFGLRFHFSRIRTAVRRTLIGTFWKILNLPLRIVNLRL